MNDRDKKIEQNLLETDKRIDKQRFKLYDIVEEKIFDSKSVTTSDKVDLVSRLNWENLDLEHWTRINNSYFDLIYKAQEALQNQIAQP